MEKKRDPWTDPDPQPGDFDEDIERASPGDFESHEGYPYATVTIVSDERLWERLGPVRAERLGIAPPKKKPARR
jgi:hypothetical protein